MSNEIGAAAATFDDIEKLYDGWSGEGSFAPSDRVISNCWKLVDLWYGYGAEILPCSTGTISFEWDNRTSYLEVGESKFSMYTRDSFINGEVRDRV